MSDVVRISDKLLRDAKKEFRAHGFASTNNIAIIVGVGQEIDLTRLDGFVNVKTLHKNRIPTFFDDKYGRVVGRVCGCWAAVYDLVPSGYVYLSAIKGGVIQFGVE